jgi:quercetin dioxygenase-like cupin family protein
MLNKEISNQELKHRKKMASLEESMRQLNTGDEFIVTHYFGHKVYARALLIEKHGTLTGKIHRFSCINFIMMGDITVDTAEGQKRIKAPEILISPPGVKRAGYAHEDTLWVTVHATEQTDPGLVEDEVIATDYVDYDEGEAIIHESAGLTPCEEDVFRSLVLKKFHNRNDIVRMLIENDGVK